MLSVFKSKLYLTDLLGGFTDIHNHILPSIDDGAKDVDDSIALLKAFQDLGVTSFINTPHTMSDYYPNTKATIIGAKKRLQKKLEMSSLENIKLKASSEYMMDSHFESLLESKSLLPLKTNYLLVEMSYLQPPINLEEILYNISLSGYQAVLAHPERYSFYHKSYDYYKHLKKLGCLFQMNLLSLTDHYGSQVKKTAHKLLEGDLIDFVATDTHHLRHVEQLKQIKLSKKQTAQLSPLIQNTNTEFSF